MFKKMFGNHDIIAEKEVTVCIEPFPFFFIFSKYLLLFSFFGLSEKDIYFKGLTNENTNVCLRKPGLRTSRWFWGLFGCENYIQSYNCHRKHCENRICYG